MALEDKEEYDVLADYSDDEFNDDEFSDDDDDLEEDLDEEYYFEGRASDDDTVG